MRGKKLVTLEDYIYFLENPGEHDLTIDHLNQILQIHGFHKIPRQPKKVIMDALRSIEMLMIPFCSTIKENKKKNNITSSSAALLTRNEVIKDLSDLQWQEYCSLQSIETLTTPSNNNPLNGDNEEEEEKEENHHLRRRSDIRCLKRKKVLFSKEMRDAKWGAKRKRNSINRRSGFSTTPTPLLPSPPPPPPLPPTAAVDVPLCSWLSLSL